MNNTRYCYGAVNSLSVNPRLPCFARLEWSPSSFVFGAWHHGVGGGTLPRASQLLGESRAPRSRCLGLAVTRQLMQSCVPASPMVSPSQAAKFPTTAGPQTHLANTSETQLWERNCLHICSSLWDPVGSGVFSELPFLPFLPGRQEASGSNAGKPAGDQCLWAVPTTREKQHQ